MKYLNNCIICLSRNLTEFYRYKDNYRRVWFLYRCKECTHNFLNPQPSWKDLSLYYSKEYTAYKPSDCVLTPNNTLVDEALKTEKFRHIPIKRGVRILDIGCGGRGDFLKVASELGATVEGLEPNPIGAMETEKLGFNVFCGTVQEYAQKNKKKFDIITLNHVIEHIPDPVDSLSVIRGLLSENGFIYLAMPNADFWAWKKLKQNWHSTDLPRHLHHFTAKSASRGAERAGLAVEKLYTYSLPAATAETIRLWLRFTIFFPRRLTKYMRIIDYISPFISRALDSENRGEALIVILRIKQTI